MGLSRPKSKSRAGLTLHFRKWLVTLTFALLTLFPILGNAQKNRATPSRRPAADSIAGATTTNRNTNPFPNSSLTFEDFSRASLEEFNRSFLVQSSKSQKKSIELDLQSTKFESPWTVSNSSYVPMYRRPTSPEQYFMTSTKLIYKNRDGLEVIAESDINRSTSYSASAVPLELSLTVSHDILHRGANSEANIRNDIQRITDRYSYVESENRLVARRLAFIDQFTGLYAIHCKLADFKSVSANIDEALETGKLKSTVKSASLRDYLVLVDVKNSFDRRVENLQADKASLETNFQSYGDSFYRSVQDLNNKQLACESLDPEKMRAGLLNRSGFNDVASTSPAATLYKIDSSRSQRQIDLLKSEKNANLAPFASVTHGIPKGATEYSEIRVGIQFTYNFEGKDKALEIRSAAANSTASSLGFKQATDDGVQALLQLLQTAESQARLIPILQRSLENSKKLIHLLRAQEAIGLVDSTAFAQTYLNYLDSLLASRDAWAQYSSANLKISDYLATSQRLQNELKAL